MSEKKALDTSIITIDGEDYAIDELSDRGKAQIKRLEVVVRRIEDLQKELAVLQVARMGFRNALKQEVPSKGR
jgi:hypothetical protein